MLSPLLALVAVLALMAAARAFTPLRPLCTGRGRYAAVLFATADGDECGACPLAPKCSGEYRGKGCDGEGKIQGGIATIGFMSWWPIKVYRPCPAYLKAGYVYRREGQTMDQVLFSEPSNRMKAKLAANRQAELLEQKAAEVERATSKTRSADSEVDKFLNDKFNQSE